MAVVPRSMMGSSSILEIWKVGLHVDLMISMSLDRFRKPKERRSWSYVKETSFALDDSGLSKMRRGGRFVRESISLRTLVR